MAPFCCSGEFATFYNIAPKRTLETSRLSNAGGKKDRQRMSLLLLVCWVAMDNLIPILTYIVLENDSHFEF